MGVRSLGWEDPLEEEMTDHPSILTWKIPWTEEPGRLQSIESQKVRQDLATVHTHTHKHAQSCTKKPPRHICYHCY